VTLVKRKYLKSRDGYFFEGLNILISTFFVWADGFQAFYNPIQLSKFFASSFKFLLIFKMLTEISLKILFSVIGRFSPVPTSA
jgi:hypothetical protein